MSEDDDKDLGDIAPVYGGPPGPDGRFGPEWGAASGQIVGRPFPNQTKKPAFNEQFALGRGEISAFPSMGQTYAYGAPPNPLGEYVQTIPTTTFTWPPAQQPDYDLRFREIMDELRTLRQALDSAKATIIVEILAELRAGTRVTDAPKKPTLRTSHRGKGKKHGRKVQARRKR